MFFNTELLDTLTAQAKENPRLRQAYDLRTTPENGLQRMFNALEPGTIMPIHRHRESFLPCGYVPRYKEGQDAA